jgi:hypothetical protein
MVKKLFFFFLMLYRAQTLMGSLVCFFSCGALVIFYINRWAVNSHSRVELLYDMCPNIVVSSLVAILLL